MNTTIQQAVLSAIAKTLRPIVRLCLKHGMGEALFSDLTRQIFVEEAERQLQGDQQKRTASAIASLTGLSRKEVSRLQRLGTDQLFEVAQKRDRATRVLSGWMTDSEFVGVGAERSLPLHGNKASFSELVKRYGGDVTTLAMLQLLLAAGNIYLSDDDIVSLVSDAYIPTNTPLEKLEIFGTDGNELLQTIEFNISAEVAKKRFQRKVANPNVNPDALEAFKALTELEAMALLERLDAWLASHEQPYESETPAAYVAVGIYFYEQDSEYDDDQSAT